MTRNTFSPSPGCLSEACLPLNVLIAERHDSQRTALCQALRALGACVIYAASSGWDAYHILRGLDGLAEDGLGIGAVDVVICDLQLPEMDGVELIRQLAALPRKPVLLLSCSLPPRLMLAVREMMRQYQVPFGGLLDKPVRPEQLHRLLQEVVTDRTRAGKPVNTYPSSAQPMFVSRPVLERALDSRAIEPWYQPKTDPLTGRPLGFEVLARWRHPAQGILPTACFLSGIELHGLMERMSAILLEQSLQLLGQLESQDAGLTLSFNLCWSQLADPALADRILHQTRAYRIEPERVVLEMTEWSVIQHMGPTLDNLIRLGMRGFQLSLDDFGAGYNALHLLAELPLDELKIDRSLVHRASCSETATQVLTAVQQLAHRIGLRTVAEGIERDEDYQLVRSLGCDEVQGHFIAPAMCETDFIDWLRCRQTRAGAC